MKTTMEKSQKRLKNMILKNSNSPSHDHDHDHDENDQSMLLPGLPNHLAHLCLSSLPPSLLYSVCRSWRRLIYSPSFATFYSLYAVVSPTSSDIHHPSSIEFFSLDPISSTWKLLPSPPWDPPIRILRRHPSFISRNFPMQSVSVSGHLILVAATDNFFGPALARPLVFNPLSAQNHWTLGPPLLNPRRWCATGSVAGSIYVASGVGSCYQSDVARSVERWDIHKNWKYWKWAKLARLRDSRFSREAVEAIGYKGKLYMVNVKGSGIKQGGVYDVAEDRWKEMPKGMLGGWNGPVGSTMDGEESMYVVDEKGGTLSKYDFEKDEWKKIFECSEYLKGAEQVAVGRGKVCVVCANGRQIVVVDVVVVPPRHWVVDPPPGTEVASLHILPRMCLPE